MKSIEEVVDYGLDQFDSDRTIEISLRGILYVFNVLGEFNRFFHQPTHYPNLESVEEFLGKKGQGAFHVLQKAYYEKLRDVWPEDVLKAIDDGNLHIDPWD